MAMLDKFFVVTVISNPVRYKRRYELFRRFKDMCNNAGVNLMVVEQAFGARDFEVTKAGDPWNVQIRSIDELWVKENLIDIGIAKGRRELPEATMVAWVDADCRPTSPYKMWFEETCHQLQHYEFVQMWENMIDIDINHNPIGGPQPGFMSNYIKYGTPNPKEFKKIQSTYSYGSNTIFGRPGLAWAANIQTGLDMVGGMLDFCILGAGDWYMAHSLVGSVNVTYASDQASSSYAKKLLEYQTRCERWIKRDVGFVPGTVVHDFHGKKVNRGYSTRGRILTDNNYDPDKDIKYDTFGQLMLETYEPRQIKMRDQIRAYFRARNEDDISVS